MSALTEALVQAAALIWIVVGIDRWLVIWDPFNLAPRPNLPRAKAREIGS